MDSILLRRTESWREVSVSEDRGYHFYTNVHGRKTLLAVAVITSVVSLVFLASFANQLAYAASLSSAGRAWSIFGTTAMSFSMSASGCFAMALWLTKKFYDRDFARRGESATWQQPEADQNLVPKLLDHRCVFVRFPEGGAFHARSIFDGNFRVLPQELIADAD